MSPLLYIITILGAVLYPLYAALFSKQIKEKMSELSDALWQAYRSMIITQWLLGLPVIIALAVYPPGLGFIGLQFLTDPLAFAGLLLIPMLWLITQPKLPIPGRIKRQANKKMKEFGFILPGNRKDYQWSMVMSFTAGICEEILFRGLLFQLLYQYIPLIPAMILANLFFSLGHVSTGLKNLLWTFILGILWSVAYYFTGSLWLPILCHIIVDMYSLGSAYRLKKQGFGSQEKTGQVVESKTH